MHGFFENVREKTKLVYVVLDWWDWKKIILAWQHDDNMMLKKIILG